MNKKTIASIALFAATVALLPPNAARADDETRALIGGLIGGIVIGSALSDHTDTHVSVGYGRRGHHRSHGYWTWTTVKQWVPGYYERSCDRYGRTRKVWISGHYTYVKEKVWVESRSRGGSRYDRYGSHDRRSRYGDRHDHRRDPHRSRYANRH